MVKYYVSCKKYTGELKFKCYKTKQNRLRLLSTCSICGKKKNDLHKK